MYKCTYIIKIGKPLTFIRNIETYVATECLINVLTCYNKTDSNSYYACVYT